MNSLDAVTRVLAQSSSAAIRPLRGSIQDILRTTLDSGLRAATAGGGDGDGARAT